MNPFKIKKGLGRGLSSLIGDTKTTTAKNIISISSIVRSKLQPRKKFDKERLEELSKSLKQINLRLWDVENEKRLCEKNADFGEKFVRLSRDVHFLNDERSKIKLEINNQTGSKIKEIKEYTNYW